MTGHHPSGLWFLAATMIVSPAPGVVEYCVSALSVPSFAVSTKVTVAINHRNGA